jgi:GNAT superfamily N-acetyltransferase
MDEPILTVTDTIGPEAQGVIDDGLHQFNIATSGIDDWQALGAFAVDPRTQKVLGGLTGRTSLGLLFIDVFFLPEDLRGGGLGSRILRMAEDEAKRRGCTAAMLVTISFQAPGFYKRNGWAIFGEIESKPGISRVFMTKALT